MTALSEFARLESEARYFDGQTAQARSVVLSFGERSLVIRDFSDRVIDHWPLASLRALGARGDSVVQLVPRAESEARLVVSDPLMIEAIGKVCPDLHHRPVDRRGLGRALGFGAVAVAAVLAIVFVLVPALAGQLALMIPPERERQLGTAVAGQLADILEYGTGIRPARCVAEDGSAALARMTDRIAPEAGRLHLPLTVSVIDHPMVNAVALPGGRILLFRGLIDRAGTPEEVAGVLAHEIGHVIHRDPTVGALRAAGTAGILGLLLGDVFGAGVIVAVSEAMLNAGYQRDAEARADAEALALLTGTGLPTGPFAAFFRRLKDEHGETPGILRYFASHPPLEERAEAAEAGSAAADGFRPVLDDQSWVALREICAETDPALVPPEAR